MQGLEHEDFSTWSLHATLTRHGWTVGLGDEAALKFRETTGGWAESYPSMEFRLGPISEATTRTLILSFDPLPDGLRDILEEEIGAQVQVGILDPVA